MRTRRSNEQIRKDIYNSEVDAYNFYVVNLDTMKAETGFQFRQDAIDVLNDYDDKKKYKVVSKRALKSMGINNPNDSFKYIGGGDFQAGVNAKGGSLEAHGIELGDTFMKTISGGIQKIKDKNGKIVYVNLANGERDLHSTFPFEDGGRIVKIVNKDKEYSKEKYQGILGDYDNDGVSNLNDLNPLDATKYGKVENIEIEETFKKLIDLKNDLDSKMYEALQELDKKAPKNAEFYARTKTPFSVVKKLVDKRLLDPQKGLTDLIGTTVVVSTQQELEKIKKDLDNGLMGEVLDFDDFYEKPNNGYRAYHYIVKFKGTPIEVQLKTKMQKQLNEVSHEFYKKGTLNTKGLNEVSEMIMKADKGDKKSLEEAKMILSNEGELSKKISIENFSNGGFLNERQINKIDEGFTISQLNDMLNQMFPYSFSFEVYKRNQNVTMFGYNYKDKLQSDDKIKLYFHQKGYDRDLNYQVEQGSENTYFTFLLSDINSNAYIGTFGFKDQGDVDSSYITKFISFLQDAYHYPLQVRHSVMADGGYFNGEIPETSSYITRYGNGGEIGRFMTSKQAEEFLANLPKNEYDKLGDLQLVYNGNEFILKEKKLVKYTKRNKGKFTDKDVYFKYWYMQNYPKDKLGVELNDYISFEDLYDEDYSKYNIYDVMGVGDSLIRERLFEHLAEIYNVSYDSVYKKLFLNDFAKGGLFNDNEGFMKADNENNYRYPEMQIYVETLNEPIDLTSNYMSKTNKMFSNSINENIDLNDDKKVRARMGYNPKNRTPQKMMMVNPRMVIENLPMPLPYKHKND